MSDQHSNYRVNVVAHTKSATNPDYAHELLTFAIQGPRPVLAEFNTHRALCRNVESSRAVSIPQRVRMLRECPYVPGPTPDGLPLLGNNKGMVAVTPLDTIAIGYGQQMYREAAGRAADAADYLHDVCNWHKQDVNRLTEPFSWTRIVATGTRAAWNHFFWLRTAADVYPPLRVLARAMCVAAHRSIPRLAQPQQPNGVTHYQSWHLPYIGSGEEAVAIRTARERWGGVNLQYTKMYQDNDDIGPFRSMREARLLGWDLAVMLLCRWSAARCATVSYYKFGDSKGYADLEARFDTLFPPDDPEADEPPRPVHASPAEHQAQLVCEQMVEPGTAGNLAGPWRQYRKCLPGEFQPAYTPSAATLAGWNIPESMFEPLT